jgi:hypothetical protein
LAGAVNVLVDVGFLLADLGVADLKDQVAVGVESNGVRAGEGQTDLVRISAGGDDEIVFELVSGEW